MRIPMQQGDLLQRSDEAAKTFHLIATRSSMRRREIIAGLAAGMLSPALPQRTNAQGAPKRLIGILSLAPVSPNSAIMLGLRRGLAESGFFEGENISFEFRAGHGP
jgi:hypothetical protein